MSEQSLDPKVPETLLKTVLYNLDNAKKELDRHWRFLIFATAVTFAAMLGIRGLGAWIAEKIFSEPENQRLLLLLLPFVNLYLFMRFGFLLAYFTGVRLAAEEL